MLPDCPASPAGCPPGSLCFPSWLELLLLPDSGTLVRTAATAPSPSSFAYLLLWMPVLLLLDLPAPHADCRCSSSPVPHVLASTASIAGRLGFCFGTFQIVSQHFFLLLIVVLVVFWSSCLLFLVVWCLGRIDGCSWRCKSDSKFSGAVTGSPWFKTVLLLNLLFLSLTTAGCNRHSPSLLKFVLTFMSLYLILFKFL